MTWRANCVPKYFLCDCSQDFNHILHLSVDLSWFRFVEFLLHIVPMVQRL